VVIANGLVVEPETAPVTPIVKLEVMGFGTAGAVGVPEITPVAVLSDRPVGSMLAVSAQVYAPEPPVAASVWL
jgi:hypothetical protein